MSKLRTCASTVLKHVHAGVGKAIERLHPLADNTVISLQPDRPIRGHALISYKIELFLSGSRQARSTYHPSCLITQRMAEIFLDLGYAVDVIANTNKQFLPRKEYQFFTDTRMNFVRLAPLLHPNCIKILHVTTAHPYYHNAAEAKRLLALQERKHVTLPSGRFMSPAYAMAVEYADAIAVPSEFCVQNFRYAQKPLYIVPNASEFTYPWAENKDFEACKTKFMWLGSDGMVHKGLDLVLEAFAEMPKYDLTVCGPVSKEKHFERIYYRELYQTPNIHTFGWIDIGSAEFKRLTDQCVGLVYPSCSEGSAGAVITCLHAGLLPMMSVESGVDVEKDIGVMLGECSIQDIKNAVDRIATLSSQELKRQSRKAWEFARAYHTMENFEHQYRQMLKTLISINAH